MFENPLFRIGVADTLNHGIMVPRVVSDIMHCIIDPMVASRRWRRSRRRSAPLPCHRSATATEHHMVVRAGNITRTACACADGMSGLAHCVKHVLVLTHSQVIVRTPDSNIRLLPALTMLDRLCTSGVDCPRSGVQKCDSGLRREYRSAFARKTVSTRLRAEH